MTIPANIDHVAIIKDLNRWGIGDRKIEAICGFSDGYARHAKAGNFVEMGYQKAARLYNFWLDECRLRGLRISWASAGGEGIPHLVATT